MKFWKKHKANDKTRCRQLRLEPLEERTVLSVSVPLVSGHTTTFYDADGTRVRVKLTGPGHGSLELTNGQASGGAIESLTLQDTTGRSNLKITTKGGTVAGTTINELVLEKALGQTWALKNFSATKVSLAENGQLTADGNVADLDLGGVGEDAAIEIAGTLGRLRANTFEDDASLDVSGTLKKFVAHTVDAGAEITANQLAYLHVYRSIESAAIDIGAGGIQQMIIRDISDSTIASDGDIGQVIITGIISNTSIASNISPGSDSNYGTIDDLITDSGAAGTIKSVEVRGALGGDPHDVHIVASGKIKNVSVGIQNARKLESPPLIWQFAVSQYLPLSISQAVADATGFDNAHIWVSVYGQEITTPGTGVVPPPGPSYFLDASQLTAQNNPVPIQTTTLYVGPTTPDLAILPSSTLAAWGGNLSLPVPAPGMQYTGRILISVGSPAQLQVANNALRTVSAPSAASASDPSNGTFYDFLEFTVTNKAGTPNLDMDTSQVDAFGMPMKMQMFQDAAGTKPYNYTFTGTISTANPYQITNVSSTANLGQGQPVIGTGIQSGTAIQSTTASTIKLNKPVTGNGTYTFTSYGAGPVGVQANRDSILSGSSSLLSFIKGKIAAGNDNARPFLQTAAPYPMIAPVPITGASNTTPIVITTDSTTGLSNGNQVFIAGVGGNTAANGLHTIGAVTSNSFTLTGVAGTGAYTTGGTWAMAITGATNNGSPIVITTTNTLGMQSGDIVEVSGVLGNTAANGFFVVSEVSGTSFKLNNSSGNGNYTSGGYWTVYTPSTRVVSPKDIVDPITNPQDTSALNNYFNSAIDAFFLQYFAGTINTHTGGGQTLHLFSDASNLTYSGTVTNQGTTTGGYVLRLTDPTKTDKTVYDIYYPFFTTNAPAPGVYTPFFGTAAPPTWITANNKQFESASTMVFNCDGVFADNTFRGMSQTPSSVLADLENSVSAAFNRGISLNDATTWGNLSTWFQGGAYNYWVEYWHQSGLVYNDLAYAFPYDDKFGASTNLSEDNVGVAKITLGQWSSSTQPTTTDFQSFPTSAFQGGQVSLSAQVSGSGSPTGTVTFYIDGVPINSSDSSSSPPLEPVALSSGTATITANLPQLSSGNLSRTYMVTAVYSGDNSNAPSVAYQPLKLQGIGGDFEVGVSPGNGHLGTTVQITSSLPGTTFDGSLSFYAAASNGSNTQFLGTITPTTQTVVQNYQIPTNLLAFTGDISNVTDTNKIKNVSSIINLVGGQTLSGNGIQAGSTISGFQPAELTLSQPAQGVNGPVWLTSGGVGFQGTITSDNESLVKGIISLQGLSEGSPITGQGIQPGTTIGTFTQAWITMNNPAQAVATGETINSNAISSTLLITVVFTPSVGGPYSGYTQFSVN